MADRSRPRWQIATAVLIGAALAVLLAGLGVWQVQRLAWKRDLIARIDSRIHAAPVPLETLDLTDPGVLEYLPVTVTGIFDHERETFVQAVTELGGGYWVLTPLRQRDGKVVLINRGFVPPDKRDPRVREGSAPMGETTVSGLLRLDEPGGAFLRDNDPSAERWFSRDLSALAKARGLGTVAPVFVDAAATSGDPAGGLTVIHFRNTHLIYALTWFTLSAMVIALVVMIVRHHRGAK